MAITLDSKNLETYIADSKKAFEANLKKLVDIPSVSMLPENKADIRKLAETTKALLIEFGARAEIYETKGNPVIAAEFHSDKSHPTVLIYNHMDVQPADPEEWLSPPFDMKVDGDKYLGRGTTDDKGPALTALYAARFARENKLPINIKIVWELEEEIGSTNFFQFLEEHGDVVATDSVVVSDTVWISRDKPALPLGFRGLQCVLIKLRTGEIDTHSGLTGGGARNPYTELVDFLARCVDGRTGLVKVPGFYDGVEEPGPEELNGFIEAGFTAENFARAHKLKSLRFEDDKKVAAHIWSKPTFEIHGISGGYTAAGVKTIIPCKAEAKVSMRLVPGQNPEKLLENLTAYVKEHISDAEVEAVGQLKAYLGSREGKYLDAACQAVEEAFGKKPALVREGGSIGAVIALAEILKRPIVFMGLSLPEHGYHSVNENFDWGQAEGGMKAFVRYFELLSEL